MKQILPFEPENIPPGKGETNFLGSHILGQHIQGRFKAHQLCDHRRGREGNSFSSKDLKQKGKLENVEEK